MMRRAKIYFALTLSWRMKNERREPMNGFTA